MRIIHKGGFPTEERRQNRAVIYSNMIVAFKVLLDIMSAEKMEYEREGTKVGLHPLNATFQRHTLSCQGADYSKY